jgi:F0F1-type ATP synthase epsilon subunit
MSRTDASTGEVIADNKPKPASSTPTMHVKVYSPFKTYFDEDAFSISAINATGPFDILPRHHNFLTLLGTGEMMIRPVRGIDQKIRISGGLMHVKADRITVFLDI